MRYRLSQTRLLMLGWRGAASHQKACSVAEEKLDLFQLTFTSAAEPGACAPMNLVLSFQYSGLEEIVGHAEAGSDVEAVKSLQRVSVPTRAAIRPSRFPVHAR